MTRLGGLVSEKTQQRKITADLIDLEGEDIVLTREGTFEDDGAGGVVETDGPVDLPAKRLHFKSVRAGFQEFMDSQGHKIVARYILIGLYDDDIRIGDTFVRDGRLFKVAFVSDDRTYQTLAGVTHIGNP